MINKEVLDLVLELVYPKNISCIICDKPIKLTNTYSICRDCFKELHFLKDTCLKCGKPIVNHSLEYESLENCSYCANYRFYFDRAISCIEYNDVSKKMVLDFKYKNKTYFCYYIAQIMSEKLELEGITSDYILFVPLHKKRLRKRGFNQAQKIAESLSEFTDIPVLDCVSRVKNTKRLYRLSKDERKNELKNSFVVKDEAGILKDREVILVDDIFTTGSTVNEISKRLRICGVSKITVATMLTGTSDRYMVNNSIDI